jgi:glutamate racemase
MQACLVCSTKVAAAVDVVKKPRAVLPLTAVSQPAVLQLVVETTQAAVLRLAAVTTVVAKAVADARSDASSFLN